VPEDSIPSWFPEKSRSATIRSGRLAETFAELSVVSQVVPTESRFAVQAGGVAVWAGGVVVPGELWAIVQHAQQQSMNNNVIIFADITLASKTRDERYREDAVELQPCVRMREFTVCCERDSQ